MTEHMNEEQPALDPTPVPGAKGQDSPDSEALASGLQPGGIIPGGGPGAIVGSFGTGGASNANRQTGDSDENTIEEPVR